MSDPLSVAGSVAGLVSLGIQVTQTLVNYYDSYRGQDSEVRRMVERLECLLVVFQDLEKTISERKVQADERDLLRTIETSIKNCDTSIRELQEECKKFRSTSSNGIKAAIRTAGHQIIYPIRRSTLQKINEDIDEIRANLSSALSVLQLKDNKRIYDEIADTKSLLDLVRNCQISSNLREWLKAPDATIDHNAACLKKHPGTGVWLNENHYFSRWLTEKNSFLWLNGFAGSGKSVLCSTAIQSVLRYRRSNPRIGIAFFYFTFNDESKQDQSAMLRALLLQLSAQLQDGHLDLIRLHSSYETSTPPSRVLIDYLRRLIERFQVVYIIIDALDESPRERQRGDVLDTLEAMKTWGLPGLHLLITSRDEIDIRESLNLFITAEVKMQNGGIDKDIANFISGRFDTDRRLRKWLPHRNKIQDILAKRAQGVFRWVDCQFTSLRSCPCSEHHLNRLLNSLPRSLDETYERMLCAIDNDSIEDARRILTLLCFASRPLTVQELIDCVAVEIGTCSGLNRQRRLQGASDFQEICPGFIEISPDVVDSFDAIYEDSNEILIHTVRIAHFSVQEYLESQRIRDSKAANFALTNETAHAEIAQVCLGYLLEPGLSLSMLDKDIVEEYFVEEYPLAHFAAKFWNHHYKSATSLATDLDKSIVRLFQHEALYKTWVKLHDTDRPRRNWVDFKRASNDIATPIYYMSQLGLDKVLRDFISSQHLGRTNTLVISLSSTYGVSDMINAKGGLYGTALQAASLEGHEKIVQLLLDKGAEVNAQGGKYNTALQAASAGGREKVVQLLLDKRAEVNAQEADVNNAQGGFYGTALQAASAVGHEKIVQLLLDKGAEVNAQGGFYGTALQAASAVGHGKIVQLLLDKGAEVNAQGGEYSTALQAASLKGHEKIIQLLLDYGAEVNAQSGEYNTALQAASAGGHEKIVQLLLDKEAEVNAQGGDYGTALQAASEEGHEKVIQLLLDHGADVNAQVGLYGNALQAVSAGGHEEIVQLLLDHGAEVNAQGGEHNTAIQAAAEEGHENIVQLLLDHGADGVMIGIVSPV